MISHDDIEAMSDGIHPDVEAAFEYARRWRKGLPSDRFCDGQKGAVAVARGIERMAQAIARQMADEYQRGLEAMETSRDPLR